MSTEQTQEKLNFFKTKRGRIVAIAGGGLFVALLVMLAVIYRSQHRSRSVYSQNMALFQPYIAAYTSGAISRAATVQVVFTEDVVTPDKVGKSASPRLLKLSPKVKGELVWLNQRTLEFTPTDRFKSDCNYTATLRLGRIIESVPPEAGEFLFSFRTLRQSVSFLYLYPYRRLEGSEVKSYIRGALTVTDEVSPEALAECIEITPEGGERLEVTVTPGVGERTYQFLSAPLSYAAGNLKIGFEGKTIAANSIPAEEFPLEGTNQFLPMGIFLDPGTEQRALIVFTQPLDARQNLAGLIHSEGLPDPRFRIDGNVVELFPSNRVDGEHRLLIEGSVRAYNGHTLPTGYEFTVDFARPKPAVKFLTSGMIVPATGSVQIPIHAVGMRAVDVTVYKVYQSNLLYAYQFDPAHFNSSSLQRVGKLLFRKTIPFDASALRQQGGTYTLDLTDLVQMEPGAMYRIGLSMRHELSEYSQEDIQSVSLQPDNYERFGYSSPYVSCFYDYDYDKISDPTTPDYYRYRDFEWRTILVSNVGLMAKRTQGNTIYCYATSLSEGRPMSGVQVQLYSYQLQPIGSGTTNSEGMVTFEFPQDEDPFLLVGKQGNDCSYLNIRDGGNSLSFSTFDVGGASSQKGLQGFFYGDRGVWRPGDSIFLTLMVEDRLGQLPSSHPVEFVLRSPRGQVVNRQVVPGNEGHVYPFKTRTLEEAQTGYYSVSARVGGAQFTQSLRVETVKPNRLKIDVSHDGEALQGGSLTNARVSSQWLHGATASNLRAQIEAVVTAQEIPFTGYEKYTFTDRIGNPGSTTREVFDGRLSAGGVATFAVDLPPSLALTRVKAYLRARVYEEAGGYSIKFSETAYSPYSRYVGIRAPESNSYYLDTDKEQEFDVVVLDSRGNPMPNVTVRAALYRLRWGWWWEHGESSLASYLSGDSRNMVDEPVNLTTNASGHATFTCQIAHDDWGRYALRVTDGRGEHAATEIVYFDWPSSYARDANRYGSDVKVLTFQSDKERYKVGETVKINVPSAKGARLLVSLENAETVLNSFWVETQEGGTEVKFKTTGAMAPNIYANITLLQPHGQTANDLPIRMYGAIPIYVENPDLRLEPVLNLPEEVRPESNFTVKLREKSGKPMTVTLAIVDEGLLDLTNFKTPDPWSYFNRKRALGVTSFDLFDDVMGAYAGTIAGVLRIGGAEDASGGEGGSRSASRFKPVVRFIGPFDMGKGEKRDIVVSMPNYLGSVRVMAVAAGNNAYGSAEATLAVRNPLMVQPTLPRQLGIQEQLNLPVAVFAMADNIRDVTVRVEVEGPIAIAGQSTQPVRFTEQGDKIVFFPLRTSSATGIAKVKVYAEGSGERSLAEVEIDVRNPNPRVNRITTAMVLAGKSGAQSYSPFAEGTGAKGTVEVSKFPAISYGNLLERVSENPYSSLEQQTSRAFVQMLYPEAVEVDKAVAQELNQRVQAFIGRLSQFQVPGGGFSFWPGYSRADYWVTSYVGHFLCEARDRGYSVPGSLLRDWTSYQSQQAKMWKAENALDNSPLQQAYRLYTLARRGNPQQGVMNRFRDTKDIGTAARWRLGHAYAITGNGNIAEQLFTGQLAEEQANEEYSYSYGSTLRDRAMMLEALVDAKKLKEALPLLQGISSELASRRWLSTQEIGFVMLATTKFAKASKSGDGKLKGELTIDGQKVKVGGDASTYSFPFTPASTGQGKVSYTNGGESTAFVTVSTSGVSLEPLARGTSNNLSCAVDYLDARGNPLNPSRIAQGTDFYMRVKVTNPGYRGYLPQLRLAVTTPSGWEARNTRMEGIESERGDGFYYQDFRDGGVETYFGLAAGETRTYLFHLNAAYAGRFMLAPVSCAALYDASVSASGQGGTVEVVSSGN